MNLVFLGSGAFGVPTLAALAARHRVVGVVSQPDRPAGRGGKMTPTPVAEWAAANLTGVPIIKPEKVNAAEVVEEVRGWPAEAWVVIAFGQYLGKKLLEGRFAVNLHASLLPRWRGAAPINAAILGGDAVTGNSVISLAEKMDAGLVYGQTRREIDPDQTAGELHDLLAGDGPGLVLEVLAGREAGTLKPVAQDEALVTLAGKFTKADGRVDFSRDAAECRRRVHGLTPWPGVTVRFRDEAVKVLRVTLGGAGVGEGAAGEIVDAGLGVVRCGGGTGLVLVTVQPAGGRAMTWEEFARGRRPMVGERFNGDLLT